MLSCWIPDTIVFNDDGETTPVWYFSNVQGKIVRTTQVSFGDEKRRLESRVQRLKAAEEAVASAGEGGNPGALMEKAACAKVKRSDGIEVRGMSLKAGEECEAVLKRAVTFLRCYHGLCFDELVLDFLRDSAGLLWLLQIKAFKLKEDLCSKTTLSRMRRCSDIDDDDGLLNGRGGGVGGDEEDTEALEREERKAREGARLQRCGFCKCDFRAHELAWRMTPLTMLQTHDILRHIGRPLSWCDRDLACLAKITYDELYSVLQVCLSCYRLSAALQSLQAVEVEAASRLGVPVPHLLPEGLGTVRQKFETPPASVSQMKVRAQTAAERNRRPKQKTEFDTSSSEEEENRLGGGEGSGRAFPCLARRGRPLSSSSAAALSSDSLPLHSTSPSPSPGSLTHPRPSSSGLVRHPPAPLVSSTPSLFPSRAFIQQQRQRGDPLAESSPVQRCGESENQTVGGEGVQTSVQGGTRVNLTRHPPPRPPSAPPERERVPSTGHMDPTGQKNKGHKGGPIEEENQNATADLLRAVIVDHHPSDGGQSKDEEAETTLLQMKYGTTTTPKQKKKPTAAIEASEDPFVVSEAPPLPFPPTSRALSPPAHFSLSAQGQQPHKDRDRDMGKPRGGPVDTVTNNCGVTEAQGQSARVVLRDVLCVETSMGELNGNKGPEFPFENTRGGGRERKKIEEEEQDEFSLVGGEFLWDLLHRHQNGTAGGLLRGHRDASTPAAHSLSPSLPRTVSPGRQTEKEEGRVSCLKQGAQVRVRGRRTVPDGDRQGIGGPLALLWKIWRGRKAAVQKRRSCLRVPAPPAMPFSWSLKMPISKSSPSLPSRGVKGKGREREEEGGGEGGDEEGRTNAGGKTFGRGSMGEWENERGTEANVVSTQIPLGFHRPIVRRPPECGSACASSEASPCSQGKRTPFNRSGSRKPPHYFFLSGEEGQEGGGRGGRGSQSRPGSPSIPPSEARGQPADTKRPARTGEDPLSGEKNDASSPSSLHASLVEIKRKGIREAAQDQVASLRVNAPRVFWFFTPPGKEETARALKDLASKRDNLSVSLWLGPHKLGSRSVELGSLLKEGIGLSLSAACSSSSSSSPAAAGGGRGGKGGGGGGGSSGAGVGASEDSVLLSRSEGHFKGPNDVLSTALLRTQVGGWVGGLGVSSERIL
uniref:Uncharacterized protein n=1 Tax=Chromera velia CCMP2878 TaxID=1169474 RepID=A0A0G4IEI1_9ALVE|eukprot:Cvel_2393.t1-p1 / transcript=Cvel_2393.t1 / gene=Cvel_2393 / organism=Chromera_velia_CCMP2878 / gene_product=hypothetical protein / transcript_product=hypothetical protein / location=Cvel_scaffold93:45722-59239(-) / protein_length=1156 / sequence_SO=supercontig / SO=protein_coding / is_pseudo=false